MIAFFASPGCCFRIDTTPCSHAHPPSVSRTAFTCGTARDTAWWMIGSRGIPMNMKCSSRPPTMMWKIGLSRWYTRSTTRTGSSRTRSYVRTASTNGPSACRSLIRRPSKTYSASAGTVSPFLIFSALPREPRVWCLRADAIRDSSTPYSTEVPPAIRFHGSSPMHTATLSSSPAFSASWYIE